MPIENVKVTLRRKRILERLTQDGQVQVCTLSALLGVTPITVRHDLDVMATEGRLLRVPGGAVLPSPIRQPSAGEIELLPEKEAIAAEAARRIPDGSTLFLNSGTTSLCVAKALLNRRLHVVTNALAVAQLVRPASFHVVLLGGELNVDYGFTYGGDAQEQLLRYQPDFAVLSVDGVDPKGGFTTHHAEEAMLDGLMLSQARQGIIAADHRKLGRAGFSRIKADGRQTVITDSGCDPAVIDALRASVAEVCVVEATR